MTKKRVVRILLVMFWLEQTVNAFGNTELSQAF